MGKIIAREMCSYCDGVGEFRCDVDLERYEPCHHCDGSGVIDRNELEKKFKTVELTSYELLRLEAVLLNSVKADQQMYRHQVTTLSDKSQATCARITEKMQILEKLRS